MDAQRFDGIARTWAAGSRRGLLAGMAATALAVITPGRAGAACTPASCDATFPCGERTCVGTECVSFFAEAGELCRAAANECDLPESCTGDSLACPTDRKKTNGAPCTDDGNVCTNDICQNGVCVHTPNTAQCADDGDVCTADVCAQGECTHPTKPDGAACPDGQCCDGVCFDTRSDELHCGGCDVVCAAGTACCASACANITRGKRNCGRCGKRCRKGKHCRGGRCR